jgi:hypothetical protein
MAAPLEPVSRRGALDSLVVTLPVADCALPVPAIIVRAKRRVAFIVFGESSPTEKPA